MYMITGVSLKTPLIIVCIAVAGKTTHRIKFGHLERIREFGYGVHIKSDWSTHHEYL